jgi:hypothetical protein
MSLKMFHLLFITVSIALAAFFASWLHDQGLTGFALATIGTMLALCGYLGWFLKKSRNFGFFTLVGFLLYGLSHPNVAKACAVCIGDTKSPLVEGVNAGVWFLLSAVGGVLLAFSALFVFWGVRARRLAH